MWAGTLAALTNCIIAVVVGCEVSNSELLGCGTRLVCGIIKFKGELQPKNFKFIL